MTNSFRNTKLVGYLAPDGMAVQGLEIVAYRYAPLEPDGLPDSYAVCISCPDTGNYLSYLNCESEAQACEKALNVAKALSDEFTVISDLKDCFPREVE